MAYYHFNKLIPVRNLDVYAGVGVGVRQLTYTYDDDVAGDFDDDRTSFDAMPLFKVGARYYFTKTFGVYGEGGYDNMSDVNLGITFRF
jgi:predicted porin